MSHKKYFQELCKHQISRSYFWGWIVATNTAEAHQYNQAIGDKTKNSHQFTACMTAWKKSASVVDDDDEGNVMFYVLP